MLSARSELTTEARSSVGRGLRPARSRRARSSRSWMASPVESNVVISSPERRPSASPARTAPSSVTCSRCSAPASTARTSSPLWLACSQSSQKACVLTSSSTAISALPGPSAPMRLTCWPARSDPGGRSTSWPGVIVTTRSAASASSRDPATLAPSLRAAPRARPSSTSHSATSRPRARNVFAAARPLTPAPTTAAVSASGRPSVSAARTAAAPVRSAVTAPASNTARSIPFDASERRTSPVTVGNPRSGLPGNDVTHFKAAWPAPSAGIARKSPAG